MKSIAIVLLACLALASAASWESCGSSSDILTGVTASSTEPKKGQNFDISVQGALTSAVSGGSLEFTTWFNGLKLGTSTYDMCEQVKTSKVCPWNADPSFKWTSTTAIPSSAPSGKYKEQMVLKDASGKQVMCILGQFSL
eukprot:TRINITY_DN5939_c0_g1_i1.p1 TRINITY_DN5939_c0_g1~~TRINITY_DN5939_c0_g1_i1.p1  ORF type:complete len:140 (+),score=30.87 TRINITY_DN5939_c0_g1_i1:54-473(+)